MPPSEQNPAPANQPVSNVPEYLHLDPIPEPQPPKSKKKLILIISVIIALVLAVAGGVAALLYMNSETDRRLYGAIENLMSTQYVTQKSVTANGPKTERTFETKYDLTDPAQPKSHSSFTMDSERLSIAGELITVGRNEYYIRFTKIPESESRSKVATGIWYKVRKSSLERAPELIRSFNFDSIVPPVRGNIVLGNLDRAAGEGLMEFIRGNSVYSYTSFTNESESAVYNLSLDSRHVGELNKKLAEQSGAPVPPLYAAMTKAKSFKMEYVLTIDKRTGNVSKITQVPDGNEKDKSVLTTVTYVFPNNISVNIPTDFKEAVSE